MVWARPLLIDNLEVPTRIMPLERRAPQPAGTEPGYREALIQRLVHLAPECLPVREIDSAFIGLRGVCTELQLRRANQDRYADNLLINAEGRICLVECKLAQNGEADRDVLAQLIDYAATLAELDYAGLLSLVRKAARRTEGNPIIEAVLGDDADQDQVDNLTIGIERSLRRSQFLLLIVGDRIRENTEKLVERLQERVNLGFTFGLVEMPIYSTGSAATGYIVQPRVLLRTEVVTRTVFVGAEPQFTLRKVERPQPAGNIAEQEFYAALERVNDSFPNGVRSLLERLKGQGAEVRLLRKINAYLDDGQGGRLTILSIAADGTFQVWGTSAHDRQLGRPVGLDYMKEVAKLFPGGTVKDDLPNPDTWNVRVNDRVAIDLRSLLTQEDQWLKEVATLQARLSEIVTVAGSAHDCSE